MIIDNCIVCLMAKEFKVFLNNFGSMRKQDLLQGSCTFLQLFCE